MVAYLSLGSNLGFGGDDRQQTVLVAVDALDAYRGIAVRRTSTVYRTEPVGPIVQPDFANLVIEVETELGPEHLLEICQAVEQRFDRRREQIGGPRSLDVDILLMGQLVRRDGSPQVPHPRLRERRFVLEPLAEIAPDARHPGDGRTASEMLEAVRESKRVSPWRAAVDSAAPRRTSA